MYSDATDRAAHRTLRVANLLARPAGPAWRHDPNRPIFAQMIVGRQMQEGCLPADLGLGKPAFSSMMLHYFPGPLVLLPAPSKPTELAQLPEASDLLNLLLNQRACHSPSELWMATILVQACIGRDHLWQDLGLANRAQLSTLMNTNFRPLAKLNTGDMKWKKFIYKQLCEREGIYFCPAPSCAACADHAQCFAPEI